ncbi:transposase [Rhodobacteraceae bacterium 2376]|uniref:Transposase n=1 Tax=Rhabdonatronobacter sediminivivens TaxID=2743469 RepID=A0A7Z0I3X8_9RHOB|nr:transposase [Rhabdonatronobacter sediminivivens]NYS26909.1 transposase [Rhabdonatronobacter sediminivivens]
MKQKQHLGAAALPAVKAGIRAHLTRLARQIAAVEALIEAEIAADPELRAAHELLRSAPGMGPVTTAVVLAHLAELGQLSRREIARLAGLAPEARESGRWQGKRRIGGGRRQVRRALYQAALVNYCHKRVDRPWIKAQLARGKAPKAVIRAMADASCAASTR